MCAAGPGSSRNPCSEQYNGWQAFSEPETRAIADFILSLSSVPSDAYGHSDDVGGLLVYISLHSYGQHLLTPWGFTLEVPPDYDDLVRVCVHQQHTLHTHGDDDYNNTENMAISWHNLTRKLRFVRYPITEYHQPAAAHLEQSWLKFAI